MSFVLEEVDARNASKHYLVEVASNPNNRNITEIAVTTNYSDAKQYATRSDAGADLNLLEPLETWGELKWPHYWRAVEIFT